MKKIYFSIISLLISVSTFAGLNTAFSADKALEQVSFTAYLVPDQTKEAVIDQVSNTIVISLLEGTDVTALVPEFTVSEGATAVLEQVSQTSGVSEVDFSAGEVVFQVVNGSTSADWTVKVEFTTAVKETGLENVKMYPNPVNDVLTISNLDNAAQIMVSNVIGQVVSIQAVSGIEMNISTSELRSGLYIVTIITEEGAARSERIIKR